MNPIRFRLKRITRKTTIYLFVSCLGFLILVGRSNSGDHFSWEMFLPAITNSQALSPSQIAFVKQIGYPQQFTRLFSYDSGKERIDETWTYSNLCLMENFINGVFVSEKSFSCTPSGAAPSH
jgi:hypothetical protein